MKNQRRRENIILIIELLAKIKEESKHLPCRARLEYIHNFLISYEYLKFTDEELSRFFDLIKKIEKYYEDNEIANDISRRRISGLVYSVYRLCKSKKTDTVEYNTETYYQKNISELEEKITKLETKQSEAKQSDDQQEKIRQELEEKKEQLEQIKREKEELKKKLDAQENLKGKISEAFVELKEHIKPLKAEKRRLNWMFGVYALLCIIVLAFLIYFEFIYLSKWEQVPNKWIDYLKYYIPVPIVGGLLWAFIYQMNRAQRQLVLIANVLYRVDYIEGLLLSINLISPNVNYASEKISQVLDLMIKNYISIPDGQFEDSIEKEISKDSINVDTFIDLVKKVKGVFK